LPFNIIFADAKWEQWITVDNSQFFFKTIETKYHIPQVFFICATKQTAVGKPP